MMMMPCQAVVSHVERVEDVNSHAAPYTLFVTSSGCTFVSMGICAPVGCRVIDGRAWGALYT